MWLVKLTFLDNGKYFSVIISVVSAVRCKETTCAIMRFHDNDTKITLSGVRAF